ncbi:MAG: MFS transporter [Propionibacteriaceae bacterium]|jgi:MFS family permease|nr:MFS transporter [Propionibacteriaceae bacterium]
MTSDALQLLRERNFTTLFVARTLALLALAFAPVALAFGVLRLPGGDEVMLSIIMACQLGPNVILMLFGGVIADRMPRAGVIAAGETLNGVCWLGIGLMMYVEITPLWGMCGLAALSGIAGTVVYPALAGIIPDMVKPDQLTQANSWMQGAAATSRLLGVVAAGAVVEFCGAGVALIGTGAAYLVSAVMTATLPKKSTLADRAESMLKQLKDGWGEFRSREWLWVVVVCWGLMYFFFSGMVGVVGPFIAEKWLGGPLIWSYIMGGEAVGAIIGVVVAMYWRPKHPIFVGMTLSLTMCLPGILMASWSPIWIIVVAAIPMGFGLEIFSVYWMTTMQLEVPQESLAKVAAYDAFGSIVFGPLGLILAGPAIKWLGAHEVMLYSSVVCVVIISLGLLSKGLRTISPNWDGQNG